MAAIGVDQWEAGFPGEDGGGGSIEVVDNQPADSVPEWVHRLGGVVVRDQEVGSLGQDREKMAHGDPVGEEGSGPPPWRGDAFYEGERDFGKV